MTSGILSRGHCSIWYNEYVKSQQSDDSDQMIPKLQSGGTSHFSALTSWLKMDRNHALELLEMLMENCGLDKNPVVEKPSTVPRSFNGMEFVRALILALERHLLSTLQDAQPANSGRIGEKDLRQLSKNLFQAMVEGKHQLAQLSKIMDLRGMEAEISDNLDTFGQFLGATMQRHVGRGFISTNDADFLKESISSAIGCLIDRLENSQTWSSKDARNSAQARPIHTRSFGKPTEHSLQTKDGRIRSSRRRAEGFCQPQDQARALDLRGTVLKTFSQTMCAKNTEKDLVKQKWTSANRESRQEHDAKELLESFNSKLEEIVPKLEVVCLLSLMESKTSPSEDLDKEMELLSSATESMLQSMSCLVEHQ